MQSRDKAVLKKVLVQCQERYISASSHMPCLMQDMVVFGGVNPLQDLNDVAVWQGM